MNANRKRKSPQLTLPHPVSSCASSSSSCQKKCKRKMSRVRDGDFSKLYEGDEWTPFEDKYFLQILISALDKDKNFEGLSSGTKAFWKKVAETFNGMTLIAKTPEELIDRLKSLKNVAMCKVCLPDTWIPKEKAFKLFREKKMSIPSLFTAKLKANSLSGDRSGSPSMTTGSVEQFRSASASTPVSRKDVSPEDKNKFVKIVQQLLRNRGTHLTDSEIRTLSFDLLNNVLLGRHQFLDIENIISLEQKDDYLTYMMGIYGIKI